MTCAARSVPAGSAIGLLPSTRSKERSEEIVAKGRLRLDLERTYKALGAYFSGQKDFVESFFLRGDRPSEGSEEGGEESEGSG
jgi:hypothetical protein